MSQRAELQRNPATIASNPAMRGARAHRSTPRRDLQIQPKLTLGRANDAFEREADGIAQRATQMPAPKIEGGPTDDRPVPPFQVTPAPQTGSVAAPPSVRTVLAAPGRPLDDATRSYMEPRLGSDLSHVRVHTGSEASESARAMMARAYTAGPDIVFAQGRYAPGDAEGRKLLAHELTHTLQQAGAAQPVIQRADDYVTITVKKGQTLYGIAEEYGTTVAALEALNGITAAQLKAGQTLKVPVKKSPDAPVQPPAQKPADSSAKPPSGENHAPGDTAKAPDDTAAKTATPPVDTTGGDPKGDKRLLVAWTIDDGPRGAVTQKMKDTGLNKIPQATWFIQYSNITAADWQKLRDVETAGGEIGIHSFYKDDDHVPWFPKVQGPAYGKKHVADPMPDRMDQLKAFNTKLTGEKLHPRFTRLPGGLISELSNYAGQLGATGATKNKVAKAVIDGQSTAPFGTAFAQVETDFKLLKSTLNALNLVLWGGGGTSVDTDPGKISSQSWTAETSGAGAREDTTTDVVDPSSKTKTTSGLPGGHGQFDKLIATMKTGDVKGMVILAHDTFTQPASKNNQDDIRAVKADREYMEAQCAAQKIQLEYRTMSSLFTQVTGKDITTYKAAY
ncbi:MAG: eCIS core domain-containing protein [Rhizomicrobium sp.]